MSRDPSRNRHQAQVLQRYHDGPGEAKRTAAACSIGEREVYLWGENERTLPAWSLGRLWDLYGDARLVSDLIGHTERPFVFAEAVLPDQIAGDVAATCALMSSAGRALAVASDAIADNHMSEDEWRDVEPLIDDLERRIATLRAARGGRHG